MPLGAIMMSTTVMLTKEGPEWSHAKTASRILNAGTRMDGLIGDLVDFTRSRLGSGIPIERGSMDLAQVARLSGDSVAVFVTSIAGWMTSTGTVEVSVEDNGPGTGRVFVVLSDSAESVTFSTVVVGGVRTLSVNGSAVVFGTAFNAPASNMTYFYAYGAGGNDTVNASAITGTYFTSAQLVRSDSSPSRSPVRRSITVRQISLRRNTSSPRRRNISSRACTE